MYSTAVCEPFCRIPDTNGRRVHRHLEDLGALNSCRASRRIETVGTDRHVQGQIDSVLGFSVRCCAIVEALFGYFYGSLEEIKRPVRDLFDFNPVAAGDLRQNCQI